MTTDERRAHMIRIRKLVKRESLQESGRRGYRATVKKYGPYFAMEKLARYRREHPSDLERKFITLLSGIEEVERTPENGSGTYDREFIVSGIDYCLLIDFVWPELKLAIEINGELHEKFEHKRFRDIAKKTLLEQDDWLLLPIVAVGVTTLFVETQLYVRRILRERRNLLSTTSG